MISDSPTKSSLQMALSALAAHPGWYIFPIRSGQKAPPCFKNELELASNNPAQIKAWHQKFRGPNWGLSIRKSHAIVMDVDCKPGKVGDRTLTGLELLHSVLPPTLTVRTPSGGLHYYFDETNVVQHRCRLGVYGFGVGINSPNYVLLPGCRLTGVADGYTIIAKGRTAPAPDWFAEYLDRANAAPDVSQVPVVDLDQPAALAWARHHLTHDALPSIAGQNGEFQLLLAAGNLKDRGLSQYRAVELLSELYNVPPPKPGEPYHPYCDPLWSVGEGATADRLDVKVSNAWRYLNQVAPGARTAEAEFAKDAPDNAGLDIMMNIWRRRRLEEMNGERPTPREYYLMQKKKEQKP